MVPLLAVTQVLKSPEQLAFLVGPLLPDLGAIVSLGASGPDGSMGGTPGLEGPRANAGPA